MERSLSRGNTLLFKGETNVIIRPHKTTARNTKSTK